MNSPKLRRSSSRLRLELAGLLMVSTLAAHAVEIGELRAGAARVDITPAANLLPAPYRSIRDHLHVRAIVLDNHATRAALVGVDLIVIDEPLWQEVSQKIAQALHCAVENILMSATHSHSTPYP